MCLSTDMHQKHIYIMIVTTTCIHSATILGSDTECGKLGASTCSSQKQLISFQAQLAMPLHAMLGFVVW